ncbi:glycosyltransferase family 2 protein [Pseudoalteromonas ardens]|uniref:Glycosyl transferase n=1 Tax=Pseudoalteromonas rubra TaxID=43658 RepID=A0A0L0ETP2_9GAMM|nr:glycosyltransferase [Pseudoalteromonas sp. R96]KNC67745.1 glycosyl transferase [Pseudoalteromonas rubra]MDK1312554.1 glycosyltransferase [Pseudoalteromonas sp. R96]
MTPLVSVIMPTYNAERYVIDSIQSVLEQTYQNWELLITDDLSTDNTVELIKEEAKKDPRIKLFIQGQNGGAGLARNNAISRAEGRFIAFLDADDLWLPEKLEKQVAFALKNDHALTFTAYQKFTTEAKLGQVIPPKSVTFKQLLGSNVIGCLTAMYDTEKLGKVYMPSIRKRQDHALWLTILQQIPMAASLQEPLALYRVDSGMSKNKFKIIVWQWRLYREVLGLNLFLSSRYFLEYLVKGYLKYKK